MININNNIMTNKKMQNFNSELYNIKDYSDAELYDILDLSNPTDRELEAKILFCINKYKNTKNESTNKIVKFYEDIHNHFLHGLQRRSHKLF